MENLPTKQQKTAGKPEPAANLNPRPDIKAGSRLIAALTRLFFRVYGRGRVIGLENVPQRGGAIFAANHVSNLDPFLGWAIVGVRRRMWGVAKIELWDHPVSAYVMACVNAIPVRRGTADRTMIRTVLELLARGETVGIFPEGTRSKDGTLQAPQSGIGLLAQKSGVPIVPVGISGTHEMMPVGSSKLKRSRLTVAFGKPMTFAPGASREEIAAQVMDAISALIVAEKQG